MEKTERGAVVPLSCGWSDIGSWNAFREAKEPDGDGNVLSGDVVVHDVKGCCIHASGRMVAALGVDNLVIVETSDAVLVVPSDRAQDVKVLVQKLKAAGRAEVLNHKKVYRPWGCYETVDIESRFQVKRITVKPGARLSLQRHHHRAEHWIVVHGTALVTRGEEQLLLSENESTYIPLGFNHRLENPGKIPLQLIEVQSGSYLGEDDIVRLEDLYGR
jgi:mannose-1-phosphate guanylyltransferase/mannose-1-phosphate guanylyltransferase/mannose-6-phosphate isomerase